MENLCSSCDCDNKSSKLCSNCNKIFCQKCGQQHLRMAKHKAHILEDIVEPKAGGSYSVICEICLEYNSSEYCNQCEQYFCHACRIKHDADDDDKSHNFMKSHDEIKICPDHEGKVLQFYCDSETCESLVCELCVSTSHANHNIRKGKKSKENTETDAESKSLSSSKNRIELKSYIDDSIKICSLGREAKLGQLYNLNTDQFLEEYMFCGEPSPEDTKVTELNHKVEIKQFDPLSPQSCFRVFGLNSREQLNVLRGFSKPQGHAAFLTLDHLKAYSTKAAGFAMRREAKEEILQHISSNLLSRNILVQLKSGKLSATHFVYGIEWGNNSALIGEEKCSMGESGVVDSLSKLVTEIQSKNISSGELDAFLQQYSLKIFRDIDTDEAVKTSQYSKFMTEEKKTKKKKKERKPSVKDMESILGLTNNVNCRAVRYMILPIHFLLNEGVESLNTATCAVLIDDNDPLNEAITYFEDFCRACKELNNIRQVMDENSVCLDAKLRCKHLDYLKKLKQHEKKIREALTSIDLQSRNAVQDSTISCLISKSRDGEVSFKMTQEFCTQQRETAKPKIEFWNELKNFQVDYIGEDMKISDVRKSKGMETYSAFFFDMDEEGFDICKAEFLKTCENTSKSSTLNKHQIPSNIPKIFCMAIDLKLNPSVAQEENVPDCNCICLYDNGSYQSLTLPDDIAQFKTKNWAIYEKCEPLQEKPMDRSMLELACPCNGDGDKKTELSWLCPACRSSIQYDSSKTYFFCECGRAPIWSYKFKCSSAGHGEPYLSFKEKGIGMNLSNLKQVETVNILILGETGVGKSTWINGIVNYLTHETLQEAVESQELINLVKSTFTMTDKSYKKRQIVADTRIGKNNNEHVSGGSSGTQGPMTYYFQYGDVNVRLIDTPGIGDTRGIQKDKENFNSIMNHLRTVSKLHGICILLQPNSSKLTIVFRFCITELLAHLHRDAAKNIVFCFTNARSTFYRPGETIVPLQTMLDTFKEKHKVTIETTTDTMYCLDNESFRFLCALRQGVEFEDDERSSFDKSWDISRKETLRLFKYITSRKPHELIGTLSLNDAKNVVLCLAEPIAQVGQKIATNLAIIDEKIDELEDLKANNAILTEDLHLDIVDLDTKKLDKPMTVCASSKCTEVVTIVQINKKQSIIKSNKKNSNKLKSNEQKPNEQKPKTVQEILYVRECHPECYLEGVQTNTIGCSALRNCEAMDKSGNCTKPECGCPWNIHMHTVHRVSKTEKTIINLSVQDELTTGTANETKIGDFVSQVTDLKTKLETTQKRLITIAAKFGIFLKENAMVPYNDALNDYIEYQIETQKNRVDQGGSDFDLEILLNLQSSYKEEIRVLESLTSAASNTDKSCYVPLTPSDIYRMREELFAMEDGGEFMEKLASIIADSKVAMSQKNEIKFNLKTSSSRLMPTSGILTPIFGFVISIGSAIWPSSRKVQRDGKKDNKVDGNVKGEVCTMPKLKLKQK